MKTSVALILVLVGMIRIDVPTSLASDLYEEAPINYSKTHPTNAITRLETRLQSGELSLGKSDREIITSLLRHMEISVESQILVFSKTSLQRSRIDPRHPRAIYFSDECYIGWCPGGLIEVTVMDPNLGPVFYAFDPNDVRSDQGPRFVRDQNCLSCHGGHFVRGIPSVFARSIPTDQEGDPLLRLGSEVIDYRTPFERRWGGWYVTGNHGKARHMGNIFSQDNEGQLVADIEAGANIDDLSPFFDPAIYLAKTSDLVALMIFEHQVATHNAITRASFDTRRMMRYQNTLQSELDEPITEEPVYDSVKRVLENRSRDLVDHLLFYEEADLPEGGVQGDLAFQKSFLSRAQRNSEGDSLRDLDLDKRLFENRCSYLINSDSFQALPQAIKRLVYEKLARALHPTEADDRYYYIRTSERARIVSILRKTHSGLPENWLKN